MKMISLLPNCGRPVAYYPVFVSLFKSVNATILFSQLVYWMGKGWDKDGWIRKTSEELQLETGLTKDQQELARKKLKELGIVQEKKKGIPPKVHFLIEVKTLQRLCANIPIERGVSPRLKRGKKPPRTGDNDGQQATDFTAHISESTDENTQKSTSEIASEGLMTFVSGREEREWESKLKEGRSQQGGFTSIGEVLKGRKPRL